MSSNLPGLDRSSRLTMLGLSWPSVADFCASSRSLAFAARMSSRASASASWTASNAAFLADVGRVASFREESFAARAASSAEALVSDMAVWLWYVARALAACSKGLLDRVREYVTVCYDMYTVVSMAATFWSSHHDDASRLPGSAPQSASARPRSWKRCCTSQPSLVTMLGRPATDHAAQAVGSYNASGLCHAAIQL